MPDDTREALERALAAGGPPGEHTRRITDAIDARIAARVRALATGAETSGRDELAATERIAEERRERAKRAEADVERLQRELEDWQLQIEQERSEAADTLRRRDADVARLTAELADATECVRIVSKRRDAVRADRARYKAACDGVSGALCDADGVVPADECRYGEAVRKLTAERDEARRERDEERRWRIDAKREAAQYKLDFEGELAGNAELREVHGALDEETMGMFVARMRRERDAARARVKELELENACVSCAERIARVAELEGALRTVDGLLRSVIVFAKKPSNLQECAEEARSVIDAALTPSAAKAEEPRCTECGHVARFHVAGHECAGDSYTGGKTCRCYTFTAPPPEPAAKGDGAKCGTCGGTGLVDGGEGGAMPPCPSCAAPAAVERWGVTRQSAEPKRWLRFLSFNAPEGRTTAWVADAGLAWRGTAPEAHSIAAAICCVASPLPPAAKGAK